MSAPAYTRRPVATAVPAEIRSRRSARPSAPGSRRSFEAPTQAQSDGWAAIAGGHHTLIHAPTGSGKTLAAFLWSLDRLAGAPPRPDAEGRGVRVLYVSPLKALDLRRRAQPPRAARRDRPRGGPARRAGRRRSRSRSRTGDTPAEDRRQLARRPPDILITTPESLYLLLTSQAREILAGVEHVIVDEVHAIAGTSAAPTSR